MTEAATTAQGPNASTETAETESRIRLALAVIAITGVVFAGTAAALFGARTALSVALGAALATANLWILARIVRAVLLGSRREGATYALIAVLKLAALFGGVYLLVNSSIADILPLALGFGALPFGIVLAQLGGSRNVDG